MNKWIKILPISVLFAGYFSLLQQMLLSSQNNIWLIVVDFNSKGEGMYELIYSLIALPFVIWYFIDILIEEKNEKR